MTPTARISSTGRIGGTCSGANLHAASSPASAMTTSVISTASTRQPLWRRRGADVLSSRSTGVASGMLGVSTAAAADAGPAL